MSRATPGRRRWTTALGIAAVVVAIDQLTKDWAVGSLSDDDVVEVVGSLQFNLAFNTGASFSVGSGLGPLLAVVVVVVVVALLRFIRHVPGRLNLLATGLVVGGALGNLVDRIARSGIDTDGDGVVEDGLLEGAVVDFIDLQWWPIFNVADMAVVVGAVLLVLGTWRLGPSPEPAPEQDAEEVP